MEPKAQRLSRRTRGRPLHLLEIGLVWPPQSFLCRKLEGLGARGLRITVVTPASRRDTDGTRLRGVCLKHLPRRGRPLLWVVLRVVMGGIAVAIREPALFRALLLAVWRSTPRRGFAVRCRRALRALDMFLPAVRVRPDVVHFEWNDWAVDYLPLIEVWGRPVVVSCRGSAVNVRPLLPVHRELARGLPRTFALAAAVHCVSDAMVRQAERYGLDRSKALVIRPAVDPTFFEPRTPEAAAGDDFHVAAVGLLRWQKGYEYGLLALRHLVDRGVPVRLDIVGGEPTSRFEEASDRARLLYAIADLGLEGRVRLLGAASCEGVRELLQRSHVLLHPSVIEGLPNVVLEAMACGLPVVVTDAGGTREAVRDGVEGFVVAPRDPQALAVALERLWRDDALRRRLGRAGRSRVEAEFSVTRQTDEFETLYDEVVREPRERSAPASTRRPAPRGAAP